MRALERRLAVGPSPKCFLPGRARASSSRASLELCGLAARALAEIEHREHRYGLHDGQAAGQDHVVKQFLVAEQSSPPASVNRWVWRPRGRGVVRIARSALHHRETDLLVELAEPRSIPWPEQI